MQPSVGLPKQNVLDSPLAEPFKLSVDVDVDVP